MRLRRNFLIFLCAVAAFMGATVAFFALLDNRDFSLRGYVDPTQTSELPFRLPRFGVNAALTQYDDEELQLHLKLMHEAQVIWIRQFVYWDQIETVKGQFDWEIWDTLIESLHAYPDFKLVAVITNSPHWSRTTVESVTAPPDDPDALAQFARTFATRYGDVVDYYQIWDEPNLHSGWGDTDPRAADYAALLHEAYHAIHAVDTDAYVLSAALAPTVELGPQNINELQFLSDLYEYGIKDFSDGVAAKPYGFDWSPDDRTVGIDRLNFSRIIALREIMVEHDDSQKALWATNWGWNSLPEDWLGNPSIWGSVPEGEQIAYTMQALDRAEREWPWLGGMILSHWQPDLAQDNPLWGFSVIDSYNSPKLLWTALTERNTFSSATNGLYAAQNPYAQYSGIWTFSNFGADIGWVDDSQVVFDFYGNDIALLLRQDDYVAYLYPQIAGASPNALPSDVNRNPYILLTSDTLRPEISLISIARDLPTDFHQLRLTADELVPDELINRWPLVGFAVSSGNLAEPYNRQIVIAALTIFIAGAAVLITAWQISWHPYKTLFASLWKVLGSTGQILLSGVTSFALLLGMYLTWGDGVPSLFRRDSVQIALSVLTSGLIYINEFSIILTIIAGLALFIIIYNRLELGLMLTIFWSPFFLFPVELYRFAFPLAEIILIITIFAWILQLLANLKAQKFSLVSNFISIDYLVILWVLLGGMSLLWAEYRSVAMTELRTLIIQPALFYAILRTLPGNRQNLLLITDALVAAGVLVAVIGLYMWLNNDGVITAEAGVRRLASVYGSPNNVGLLLGRCLPLLFAFVVLSSNMLRRNVAMSALILMTTAVILSQSAGALFLGIPTGIAVVVLLRWKRRALIPLFVLAVILVVGMILALQSPRFSRFLDITGGTNFYRLRVWQSSINMVQDYPITGLGLDQFLYKFRGEYIMPDAWEEPNLSHPHNVIFDFWLRLGILGVLLFFAFQYYFWKTAYQLYHFFDRGKHVLELSLIIGLMGSMGGLLAHGLVDNSIFVLDLAYIFVFLLGSVAMLQNIRAIDA